MWPVRPSCWVGREGPWRVDCPERGNVCKHGWRGEGWNPAEPPPESPSQTQTRPHHHTADVDISSGGPGRGPYAPAPGSSVRAYTL